MIKLSSKNDFYSVEDLVEECESRLGVPSFQRSFCWGPNKICLLFDSILRGFYVGTIHLAQIPNNYNSTTKVPNSNLCKQIDIKNAKYLILDGLQRLSSINISLNGSFDNKELYMDLLYKNTDPDINEPIYNFQFLTKEQVDKNSSLLFKVADCYNKNDYKIKDILYNKEKFNNLSDESKELVDNNLAALISAIKEKSIPVHIEEGDENSCIESFIRINKGGVAITISDIIFAKIQLYSSKITKQYLENKIENWKRDYNYSGTLKNLMNIILLIAPSADRYKISNFNEQIITYLDTNCEKIFDSIEKALKLITSFNLNVRNITDATIVLISIFMLKHDDHFIESTEKDDCQNKLSIFKFLILEALKRDTTTGGQPLRGKIATFKNLIDSSEIFPGKEILEAIGKTYSLSDDEINILLELPYKNIKTTFLLNLLFHNNNIVNPQMDHIFPISKYKNSELFSKANSIVNLELLSNIENNSKNAKEFNDWLQTRDSNFKSTHLIPELDDYNNFEIFYNERKKLIIDKIKTCLNDNCAPNPPELTDTSTSVIKRAAPFKFSMINVAPGEVVTFIPTSLDCIVVDDKTISYNGEEYSLSGFCVAFMPDDMRNAAEAYQGPKYFSYNGKSLVDLRNELKV